MRWFVSACAVVAACLAASTAIAAEPGSPEAPIVVSRRDYDAVGMPRAVYPERALLREAEGAATILCQVVERGRLRNCSVKSETPEGYGFGKATLELSRSFKMKATTSGGVTLQGKWVSLTQTFRLTG